MTTTTAPARKFPSTPARPHARTLTARGRLAIAALAAVSCAAPATKALAQLRGQTGPYELEVLVDGTQAPTFAHAGETFVMGRLGERYTLRVWNRSGRRIEAVVSVDGRDVIDGKAGDFRGKRGYLVPAWSHVDIDGWRLSQGAAAAFRFSTVADSYAGRMGAPRNVGVIGVAVFPERVYTPPPPPPRPIYPHRPPPWGGYGPSPDDGYYGERRADAEESKSAQGEPSARSAPAAPTRESAPPSATSGAGSAEGELADSAAPKSRRYAPAQRPGLGTEFGEAVHSPVHEVSFTRANPSNPSAVMGVRYNDRDGLIARGIDVDGAYAGYDDGYLRQTAEPFPVSHRRYAGPPPGWRR